MRKVRRGLIKTRHLVRTAIATTPMRRSQNTLALIYCLLSSAYWIVTERQAISVRYYRAEA